MNFRLYDRLPQGITVDGRFFKCNFSFRNALKMLDIMRRKDLQEDARVFHCVKCAVSHKIPSKMLPAVYDELCNVLFGKAPETDDKPRITSFEQDAPLIRAAFRQVYGIDLFRDELTWFEFTELLQGLPDGNRFEDVVSIRARPLPAPTKYNAKERESLLKAKASVALHMTEEEQKTKYEKDVGKIFAGLFGMIPKEVNTDDGKQ